MAEGGRFEKSIDGSEIFYDFNCSVCIRTKGVHSEAAYYCPRCNVYYCKHCFTQSGCDHDPIGRGNVAKWGKTSQRIFFDECPEHSGNTIQLYCPKDDVVCCAICSQAQHKFCGEQKYIPQIVNEKENKEALKRAETEIQQIQTQVESLLQDKATRLTDLDDLHKIITEEIREVKSKIIDLLNKLEQNSLNEVNKFKKDLSEKIKSELQCLNNTKAEMIELLSNLRKPKIDDSLLFARLTKSKKLIEDKKQSISDIANVRRFEKASFFADTNLLDCIQSLNGLGVIKMCTYDKQQAQCMGKESITTQRQSKVSLNLKTRCTIEQKTNFKQNDSHDTQQNQGVSTILEIPHVQGHFSLKPNQPFTVGKKTSFNVKVKEDKAECYIYGMCQLSDGSIIVADFNNARLKQLDSTYKVTSQCPLSAKPCDVCSTEESEVAVALWSNTIQFVSVGDKLTATRSFATDHGCEHLAYHNKCLYVIAHRDTEVYVHNLSGTLLRTIYTDQQGKPLFNSTSHITVNPVSGLIHVAEGNKGLVTVDLQGNLLATFNPGLSQGADLVCVDWAGNLFVNFFNTSSVVQVSQEGDRKLAQIMSQSDGIRPRSLCFDNVNTRLIVPQHDNDTVTVLQLAQ